MLYIPWIGIGREYVAENGEKYGVSSLYYVPVLSGGKYYSKINNKRTKWYVSIYGFSPSDLGSGSDQLQVILRYKNIQLSGGFLSDRDGNNSEAISSIGYHFPLSNFSYFNTSFNFNIGSFFDEDKTNLESGRVALVDQVGLVDINYEMESRKMLGFGLRANIGLRIQNQEIPSIVDFQGLYFNLFLLLLTFGE